MGLFQRKRQPRDEQYGEEDIAFRKRHQGIEQIGYPAGKSPDRWRGIRPTGQRESASPAVERV